MSLIIYNRDNKEYGIKQIDESLFKKLMYNEIHKRCRFSIPVENIVREFGSEYSVLMDTNEDSNEDSNEDTNEDSNDKNIQTLEKKIKSKAKAKAKAKSKPKDAYNDLDEGINEANTKSNVDVLYMGELNQSQLESYLEIYKDNEKDTLGKFIEFILIVSYNQINLDRFSVKKKINLLLSGLSEYWEDPYNCNYSLTDKFNKRKFNNMNYNGFDFDSVQNINSNFEIDWNKREINYLNDIIKFNDWKEMCIHKYYVPTTKSDFNCTDIVQIYNQLPSEYTKYLFVCNMLCSRTHCHLILNNKEFLQISHPLFEKYKLVFKYLIGYAWITLKNEEYHIYHKMTDDDRIVFDIDTVELLPIYPFTFDDINQNPYACLLIDNDVMEIKKNCLTMEMMRNYTKYYGVCSSGEFSRRLNIFVNNGTNESGILSNIDWNCCVISGSVVTACGMKYNPLIDICKTTNNPEILTDGDLSNYFFHYYSDSDIDLICNKKSVYDFIDVVDNFISKSKLTHGNISVSNIHTGTIVLSDEFILENLKSINKALGYEGSNLINVDFVKSNFSNPEIKKYFYSKYYLPWKKEQKKYLNETNKNTAGELIQEYLSPIPEEEFRLYSLDYELDIDVYTTQDYEKYFYSSNDSGENKIITAKLSESIRFKVSNPNTKTFEIFKSRDENFFSIVSRFHLGFVRAFWNGKTVKCLPSYISSMMLQFASDYKYFASIRDPIEIVNKYRSRGWGIILNQYERLHMAYYNSSVIKDSDSNAKWIKMYKINIKSKQSVENIFGVKKSSDEIFKPSKYFIGIPDDCFKNVNHDTVSSFNECFNSLITPPLMGLSKSKAIGDNGKINPLDRNIIDLGWTSLNK